MKEEYKIGWTEMKEMVMTLHASRKWEHNKICWGKISTSHVIDTEDNPYTITLMINGTENTVFQATSDVLLCYRVGKWIDEFCIIYQREKTKYEKRAERENQEKIAIELCKFLPIQDDCYPTD